MSITPVPFLRLLAISSVFLLGLASVGCGGGSDGPGPQPAAIDPSGTWAMVVDAPTATGVPPQVAALIKDAVEEDEMLFVLQSPVLLAMDTSCVPVALTYASNTGTASTPFDEQFTVSMDQLYTAVIGVQPPIPLGDATCRVRGTATIRLNFSSQTRCAGNLTIAVNTVTGGPVIPVINQEACTYVMTPGNVVVPLSGTRCSDQFLNPQAQCWPGNCLPI